MLQSSLAWMETLPAWQLLLIAIGSLLLITLIDYFTEYDFHFFLFYAFQVSFVAWFLGHRRGILDAWICTLAWWALNYHLVHPGHSLTIATWNTVIRLVFFVLVAELIHALKQQTVYLTTLADNDTLTGLKNRRSFYEGLKREYSRGLRKSEPMSLIYLDLDNFKTVNDTLGHLAGDQVLIQVGQTLKNSLRQSDLMARLGGDEFVILMPDTLPEAALQVTQRLKDALLSDMQAQSWPITFSIGIASFKALPDVYEQMVQQADQLMYQVKHTGKNNLLQQIYGEVSLRS